MVADRSALLDFGGSASGFSPASGIMVADQPITYLMYHALTQ